MSLDVLVASALKDAQDLAPMEQGTVVAASVIKELEDTPIRAEIFERIQYDVNVGVTIADVHIMMDALVRVLRGD